MGTKLMKKKIKYTDDPPGGEPVGKLVRVPDFLPPPDKLVFKKDPAAKKPKARKKSKLK